jgi:NADPH:quinone reductase-like Zn-dependent oxidoreductase
MTSTMRAFRAKDDSLVPVVEPVPTPGARQVLVRVKASSVNARDLMIAHGIYPRVVLPDRIPLSDGAGVVEAVGPEVTRLRVGDRVANAYFSTWYGGPLREVGPQYGSELDGWLTEYAVADEQSLVVVPDHLSFEEAATLPCAGVTAWSAVAGVGPGDTLLVLGSGGVSVFALQLALAAGARVIATTSSDTKAERLLALGASDVVNYVHTPAWGARVRELTAGRGVDAVVEVGGGGTVAQSLGALALGGRISLVGSLAGAGEGLDLMRFFFAGAAMRTIGIGSRSDFEDLNRVLDRHRIHPVVDRVFPLDEAPDALAYAESGSRFGKVVISH